MDLLAAISNEFSEVDAVLFLYLHIQRGGENQTVLQLLLGPVLGGAG